ncbi:MAG: 3,4-dihydroxy-2-butanone-4-phosphate synthase, partial [Bacteroidales bacterium]|nr:3,4-dihydroxy-2-butanone-4-phosphate synthase [Bacteroidales bacterium]
MSGNLQEEHKTNDMVFNSIDEAIDEIKKGNIIIVVDDEDRENEGDFVAAAENITTETVNFMATYGRGLICAALSEERCQELELDLMVGKNTSHHDTAFTISVDLLGHGTTTGISASDRAKTIRSLVNPVTRPGDLGRPGHIFPLKAKSKGVLRRTGHTEATVDLTRLAGLKPGGALVEIMNEDGSMARLPQLLDIARKFNLKLVTIKDLIAYRLQTDSIIIKGVEVTLPTTYGSFRL